MLFARGGAWTAFQQLLHNLNATPQSPILFDSYAPSWGGTAKPWIKASGHAFVFGTSGDPDNDGGYTIRNLKLEGVGAPGAWGLFVSNNVRNVTLEDLEITGFEIGIYTQNGLVGAVGNTFLTVCNNDIHHNSEMGMLGDANDMVLEGNTFASNNFSGSGVNHGLYLGGHGHNGVVRNNTFTHNSVVNGKCTGGNLTVHGQWDGLLVEGNTVTQTASDDGCYGISINGGYPLPEYFRKLVVRGNTVANVGGCAICLTSAPGALIENNVIVNTQPRYQVAIVIPTNALDGGDDADDGAIIRNNSIYMTQAASGSEGIGLRANSGSNVQVVSNLIQFGAASDASHHCFAHGALSSVTTWSNNLCHHVGGTGAWSASYATLASAQAAGFDTNGLSTDPLWVTPPTSANSWSCQLQAGSATDAGHPTLSSPRDRFGMLRVVPDIGACEN